MTQTALWLPNDMHRALKAAAGRLGMGAEIRKRLAEWQVFHDAGYRVESEPAIKRVVTP